MSIVKNLKTLRVRIMNILRLVRERLGYVVRKFKTPVLPIDPDGKVYVNLGCGAHTAKEFTNVDTRPMPHIHYIHEVEELPMFQKNTVDLLYASHLLEHVPRGRLAQTLHEWHRVLKPGGILRFGVPDFDGLLKVYELSGRDVRTIVSQLMGADAPYDDHHTIWNFAYAKEVLESVGFANVRIWTPKDVEHHDFVDKTMRSIHIKGEEVVISLNIEATK